MQKTSNGQRIRYSALPATVHGDGEQTSTSAKSWGLFRCILPGTNGGAVNCWLYLDSITITEHGQMLHFVGRTCWHHDNNYLLAVAMELLQISQEAMAKII